MKIQKQKPCVDQLLPLLQKNCKQKIKRPCSTVIGLPWLSYTWNFVRVFIVWPGFYKTLRWRNIDEWTTQQFYSGIKRKKKWSAYLFWRYQVSRGQRKMICLPVLTISSFKRREKDHLLTCFDDIKLQEEKERWSAYVLWRYQVSRGERKMIYLSVLRYRVSRGKRKMICLRVLTISSFKKRKKDDIITCFDDIKFQEEKERWSAYLFWRNQV